MKTCRNCNKTHSSHFTWYQMKDGLYCSDKCVMKYGEAQLLKGIKEEIMAGRTIEAIELIDERLK